MSTSEAKRLARKFLILFTMVVCLALVGGEQTARAWPCNPADSQACARAGGRWYPTCCVCAEQAEIVACEWDGFHFWNACVGECWLNQ